MASIDLISGLNIESFGEMIPEVFKNAALSEPGFRFYGIEENSVASGVIIMEEASDRIAIRYLYLLPEYRGTGMMDEMVTMLFFRLQEEGFTYVTLSYLPEIYPGLRHFSKRYGFVEEELDYAYFRLTSEDFKKSKAAAIVPKGVMRLRYLPDEKRGYLMKLVDKSIRFYEEKLSRTDEIQSYSMVYMDGELPKAALVIEEVNYRNLPVADNVKMYPEPGSMEMMLFFVGTANQKAPIALLSALCKLIRTELPEDTVLTGYFPEGHVTRLLEGIFGKRGSHEYLATLDLTSF